MKILHTADWHLGKRLHSFDLLEDQQAFLDWISSYMLKEQVDLLLIAGDIFDTAYPNLQSQEIYTQFLAKLYSAEYPKQVIITDGNHDGKSTLRITSNILKHLNVSVVCDVHENRNEHIIPVKNGDNIEMYVVAVPFLRDQDLRKSSAEAGSLERSEVMKKALRDFYNELAEKVQQINTEEKPVIAMGHLFTAGAESEDSDSERPIQMGHQAGVSADIFSSIFDYVALGHIHRAQKFDTKTEVRYSGSPYPLSFSERNYEHKMWLIETDNKIKNIEAIKIPAYRKLVRLEGTFDNITSKAETLGSVASFFPNLVEVHVKEELYDPLLRSKIDEWKNQWHQRQEHSLVAKYTYAFEKKSETASSLYDHEKISQENFTAKNIFLDMLNKDTDLDENMKQNVVSAFESLENESH
ncbi:metallophosphoesterase family protein [Aureibacter tunicatorum]|uniref:Nuclease SbcCD subunit D n=1 Tax=Aureibacter tunicatorum TaxID=866807 RepID=A0AAE3XPI1_9BACT|nr:exonuclease subunit SbcD [Aureibacter tunicatorum]MDR6240318.1 exonuclease SbcD [Aureibacter tunicatorum]BDD05801.1 hypothetical protein AUTU_32840 [Aureibacter tunicatorum]